MSDSTSAPPITDEMVTTALNTYVEWASQGAERDVAMCAALKAVAPAILGASRERENLAHYEQLEEIERQWQREVEGG